MKLGEGLLLYSIGIILLSIFIGIGIRQYRETKSILEKSGPYDEVD